MKIRSFKDIEVIDSELAGLFLRPDAAVGWIYAVENGIKEWIGNHNKQHWEIVRYVSEQRGILGKLRRDRKRTVWLKREDFARVLLTFCPGALREGETVSALKSSMEHYEYMDDLRHIDCMSSGRIVCHHIKEVEALLDNKPLTELYDEERNPTLEDLVEEYLRREVDGQAVGFPRSKVCVRPQYDGFSPALSVETYKSEQFLLEHRPSHIEAYEFVDGVLQKSRLFELVGQYGGRGVKLYVVSHAGLLPDVRALAQEKGVGYVRLNPHSAMTSENYVLPRSIEDYSKWRHDLEVLEGRRPMTTPILILNGADALGGPKLTSSLADVLGVDGVVVKKHRLLNIPYLSEEAIEARAGALTQEDEKAKRPMLNASSLLNADFSFNPFSYAEACGLSFDMEEMEDDHQLGCLDVENNRVILNYFVSEDINRYRFTMAHELGHHILHSPLFKQQGVVSVGESEDTLSINEGGSRRLEYQANKFASCLLMPKNIVWALYLYFFELYVHQVYGDQLHTLYYNPDQPETWASYNNIVKRSAMQMHVSVKAMEIRLKSLGLLKMPDS
ncbi:MAG: ImmA/IrrE family metallo-endopeptidase [Bacteroidaceae bacterium]|nr:ImmA/IrrE family metallo-endopeptidase [Bacteroidaceae bacterium]